MNNILTDESMAAAEEVAVRHGALTDLDARDLAWDVVEAALPEIEKALRKQIGQEVRLRLPELLREHALDDYGWLSDAQHASPRIEEEWVAFHGSGSIDTDQVGEYATAIVEQKEDRL